MKTLKTLPLFLLLFAVSVLPAQTQAPATGSQVVDSWKQVPIPTLKPFHPQEPKRIELPNGLVIFLQEDHELPLIHGSLRIRGGARDEPAAKTGLVELYSEVWRTGGTHSKTGDELDDTLEARAALVETSAGGDSTVLSWSSLKEDFDQTFAVAIDLLQNPEFRQDKIDLAKEELHSLIARRNDDVNSIAQRESTKLAYGSDSPLARSMEHYTIDAVTRNDLIAWHKETVAPNNMLLGISGDFDSATMERKLREAFGKLARGKPYPKTPLPVHPSPPGLYFIEKDDVNQSVVEMVELGIERRNPDYYAVDVMSELFGGGFSSRLFSNIRTKLGLAYGVGGDVGTAYDHPGVTRITLGTKSGSTAAAIDALNRQIQGLLQDPVTDTELRKAKDAILNSFIFSMDSKEKVMGARMTYEFYGYPADFLERYRTGIEKVTAEDVQRVAKKYVHPDAFSVLVVGNSKEFDRNLSTFGKVTPIDISIPTAPPKARATGD